ncbi:separin protein [Lecanora helva]
MTLKELPAQAANLERAISSSTTCTPATVESLKSFLLSPGSRSLESKERIIQRGVSVKDPLSKPKSIGRKPKREPKIDILEVTTDEYDGGAKEREKTALATTVINVTLKSLAEAVKHPPTDKKRTSLRRVSSRSSIVSGSEPRNLTPLQPLCINRLTSTAGEKAFSKRSSSTLSSDERFVGFRSQAECSRVACAALRLMQAQKAPSNGSQLQIESAMSALIGKFIAMGFEDLALKELRILKRRLDSNISASLDDRPVKSKSTESFDKQEVPNSKAETLDRLLCFSRYDVRGQLLSLIISTQLQTVKLIVLRRDPRLTRAVFKQVCTKIGHSPVNMIQRQIDLKSPGSQDKATLQLESFSQSLLALCPNVSATEDCMVSNSADSLDPNTSFDLQVLALQVRQIWWKLADHQVNLATEIIRPFQKFLGAFCRRSTLAKEEKYRAATAAFCSLLDGAEVKSNVQDQHLVSVYSLLADLAQGSSQYHEAIKWVEEAGKGARHDAVSEAKQCSLDCRLASLHIQILDKGASEPILKTLTIIVGSLAGNLRGNPAELDDLVAQVAKLRKSAFSIYQEVHKPRHLETTHYPSKLIDLCSNIILLCPRFLLRYVGSGSNHSAEDSESARLSQRRRLAATVSNPIINSVVSMARSSAKVSMNEWRKLDVGLRDCYALALTVENETWNDTKTVDGDRQAPCLFILLSNAYWNRYLHLKEQQEDTKSMKGNLRTSIDIIEGRLTPKQKEDLLIPKLERYAHLCESIRDYNEAMGTYQQTLLDLISLGHLEKARDSAKTKCLPQVFEDSGELQTLAKTLVAYPKAAAKAMAHGHCGTPYLDVQELSEEERGIVLEQQLMALLSIHANSVSVSGASESINVLAKTLLSLYTEELFPIRRLRIAVRLLCFVTTVSYILDGELEENLTKSWNVPKHGHSDLGLLESLPYFLTWQEVIIDLRQQDIDLEKVDTLVRTWSKLFNQNPVCGSVNSSVNNLDGWLSILELLSDYLSMRGLESTRLSVLHLIVTICEAEKSNDGFVLVSKLASLGLCFSRLGYSGHANEVFRRAENYLGNSGVSADMVLEWYVSHAEHALYAGDCRGCENSLSRAQKLHRENYGDDLLQKMRTRDRSRILLLTADVHLVSSLLAIAEGQPMKALYHARINVKRIQKCWAILERNLGCGVKTERMDQETSTDDQLASAIHELSITETHSTEPKKAVSSAPSHTVFWSIVPRLFQGFVHLSHISAFCGLALEIPYYLGQAQKAAESACAPFLLGQQRTLMGRFLILSGKAEKGFGNLQEARELLADTHDDRHSAEMQLVLATYKAELGSHEDARAAFTLADRTLQHITRKSFLDDLVYRGSQFEGLDIELSALSIKETALSRQSKGRKQQAGARNKPAPQIMVKEAITKPTTEELPEHETIVLNHLKGEVLKARSSAALYEGNLKLAGTLLSEAASLPCSQSGAVSRSLLASQIQYHQGIRALVTDPLFGVLPESAVSCPSLKKGNEVRQQEAKPCRSRNVAAPITARNQSAQGFAARSKSRNPPQSDSKGDLLGLAQASLSEILRIAKTSSTTFTVHEITNLLGKISTMLSTLSSSSHPCNHAISSSYMVFILETGRLLSVARESMAISVERRLEHSRHMSEWPELDLDKNDEKKRLCMSPEFADFKTDYLDIIPKTWTAISMTLSETKDEILICKILAGRSPFVLRLPLSRSSSLEVEEENFGFDVAMAELREVIKLTNESTHGTQDLSQKGAKTQWWEARSALDARLKDLLTNIENVWFGGFKGIFSTRAQDQELLARLQQSIQNILDKHLPSRRQGGRANKLVFDLQIMELFVGLGSPSEMHDIDEALTDLLYFIVDILQFNGERNAYDEVDFDSIAIETTDALRQYHQAVNDQIIGQTEQHTILILDRQLHCFPWESLPCMSGQAICRLPSIGCLRDRILIQKERTGQVKNSSATDRIYANRNSGAYILNPGGDLKTTQEKFERPLQELSNWQRVVQEEPTEPQMKTILEDNEILLYFGHGSGGQFIRPRTIKKLEKCAVALLMGCSSGALTQAGKFESYGTPMNYMHAGSPAMLATLWDVTDKDIDRFSQSVLEDWGLFSKPQAPVSRSPVKRSTKQKGKKKVEDVQEMRSDKVDPVSLDVAVARGRDSCILKYLNGAAPVIYGVPVWLS